MGDLLTERAVPGQPRIPPFPNKRSSILEGEVDPAAGHAEVAAVFVAWRGFNTESSPNVEHGKMWSEPDECALGADLRVIDSTFYFFLRRFSYRATVGREGECLIHSLLRSKCDLDLSEIAAVLHRDGYARSTIRRHPFRK